MSAHSRPYRVNVSMWSEVLITCGRLKRGGWRSDPSTAQFSKGVRQGDRSLRASRRDSVGGQPRRRQALRIQSERVSAPATTSLVRVSMYELGETTVFGESRPLLPLRCLIDHLNGDCSVRFVALRLLKFFARRDVWCI